MKKNSRALLWRVQNPILLLAAFITLSGEPSLQAMEPVSTTPPYYANWQKLGAIAGAAALADAAARGKKSLAYLGVRNAKKFGSWLWHGSKEGRLHDAKAHLKRNKKRYLTSVIALALLTLLNRRYGPRDVCNAEETAFTQNYSAFDSSGERWEFKSLLDIDEETEQQNIIADIDAKLSDATGDATREQLQKDRARVEALVFYDNGDIDLERSGLTKPRPLGTAVSDYLRARRPGLGALVRVSGAIEDGGNRREVTDHPPLDVAPTPPPASPVASSLPPPPPLRPPSTMLPPPPALLVPVIEKSASRKLEELEIGRRFIYIDQHGQRKELVLKGSNGYYYFVKTVGERVVDGWITKRSGNLTIL